MNNQYLYSNFKRTIEEGQQILYKIAASEYATEKWGRGETVRKRKDRGVEFTRIIREKRQCYKMEPPGDLSFELTKSCQHIPEVQTVLLKKNTTNKIFALLMTCISHLIFNE